MISTAIDHYTIDIITQIYFHLLHEDLTNATKREPVFRGIQNSATTE